MDKRIHSKTKFQLTYRHYLLHFKWPLLTLFVFTCLICCILINYNLFNSSNQIDSKEIEVLDKTVIYPIDVLNRIQKKSLNLNEYFIRKDRLKTLDDLEAQKQQTKIVLSRNTNENSSKDYLILEYTKVFSRPKFCGSTNEQIFGHFCPYTNCKYTCDRKYENISDVLLMHKRDLNYKKLDEIRRNPEQIWLLWHDESNEKSSIINKYKFNWTITYRTSAEASIGAYGITLQKRNLWSKERFNNWIDHEFRRRRNQAVWFVSNCKPKKRLTKFRSLREHYAIVAFGKCILPDETYSKHIVEHSQKKCSRRSSCEKDFLENSKFYLAFESQTCKDYITEKFWRTLKLGAIPIVSGPKRADFQRVAPPNSFIHVDDFETDEQLAQLLNSIEKDKNIFEKYHFWRQFYDVYYEAKDVEPFRFCELCYRLNTNKQRIWYENLNEWFLDQC